MIQTLLIICEGNICRSPMAEALLKKALQETNQPAFKISSAGLGALIGSPPDETATNLMAEMGIDITGHRARQINSDMISHADLILVMETAQQKMIEQIEPSAKGKVFRLGEWGGFDVPDPYQQDIQAFELALDGIEKAVAQWKAKLTEKN